MRGRLLAVFEVLGVLALGWVLTRVVAALVGIEDLESLLATFIAGDGDDFTRLSVVGFETLFVQFLCLMVPAVLVTRFVHRGGAAVLGITTGDRSLAANVEMGVVLFCVAGIPMKLLLLVNGLVELGEVPGYWVLFDRPWNASFWVFMAVGSYAVIPVVEELFYRGYVQGRLAREAGFGAAVVVALLFAAVHFQYYIADVFNLWMLASLAVLGFAMAVGRHLSGSVVAAIVIHALMNVPLAPPFDAVALVMMLVAAGLWRRRIAELAGHVSGGLRGVGPADLAPVLVVVAFAVGMALLPELTLLVLAVAGLVSVTMQAVSPWRAA